MKYFFRNRALLQYIDSLNYLPRSIILLIDIFIVIIANVICYTILKNLNAVFYETLNVPTRYGISIAVNVLFFIVFKTYSGIIRHTTFIDGIKLLMSTGSSLVVLIILNYCSYLFVGEKIYLLPGLFVQFVLNFLLLFLFRIFVKNIFESLKNSKSQSNALRTMIYGTDANAIFVATALKAETPARFKLIAFISKFENNATKTMYGLPILNSKHKLPVLLRSRNANALVLADTSLTLEEKRNIVDMCLDYNIKVFSLPSVSDWENLDEISKKVKKIEIADLLDRNPIVLNKEGLSKQVKANTVMITGAAGSIGSEIVRQVMSFSPKKIILVDQAETPLHQLSLELSKRSESVHVCYLIADVRNYEVMEMVFQKHKPSIVYHAAAYKHVPLMEDNPDQAIITNIKGTKNLADLALIYGVKRFVMISTDKAVNPSNVMGASKRIAEKYVQALFYKVERENGMGTKYITTRFGNVLGSNGSVVPLFTKQIDEGGPITITHQDIIRYFMTIPEACQLVMEAGTMGNGGEIYIFDMGKPVKIIDLARKMIQLAGMVPDKDIAIKIVGLRPGEKLYEELLNDTSKTMPTHHEKIMIATEIVDDYNTLNTDIEELIALTDSFDSDAIVAKMKEIVPEFKSMNSNYVLLDK
ncbi:MAG: polysaccharide biosynthesis protein [Flavobacterium sp.]